MLKRIGYTAGGFVLIGVLAVAILWGLSVGTVQFSFSQIFNIVIDQFSSPLALDDPMNSPDQTIIWLLRMPRLLMAAVIGAGLAVSGVIMQAIVKNPLADPYILGISSGASLGATVAILFGVGVMFGENFVGVMAFIGAMAISFGVLFISNLGTKLGKIDFRGLGIKRRM